MASSSLAPEYPSSGYFSVLVQRFKLLNLVQRVAHRDVSEMIDTVGLENLARKGTLSRWAWREGDGEVEGAFGRRGAAPARYAGYGKYTAQRSADGQCYRAGAASAAATRAVSHRTNSPPGPARMTFGRSTTGFEARIAAARWHSEVEKDKQEEGGTYGGAKRRRYAMRHTQHVLCSTPADRDAFFSRLAELRERPEPVMEEVLVYDAEPESRGGARRGSEPSKSGRGGQAAHVSPKWPSREEYNNESTQQHPKANPFYTVSSSSSPPPQVLSCTLPHGASRQRAAAERSSFDVDDIRAHFHGISPVYAPHSRSPTASVHFAPQPGEGRYDTDYLTSRGGRKGARSQQAEEREDEEGALLPSALHAEGGHEVEFTTPPARTATAACGRTLGANAAFVVDVPVQRCSVNFASNNEDDTNDSPMGGEASQFPNNFNSEFMGASADDVTATNARGRVAGARHKPDVPALHFPQVGNSAAFTEADGAAGASNLPDSCRGGWGNSSGNPQGGPRVRSNAGVVGFPKSPRMGRELAKAKPKRAVGGSQVPMEAVRQAAALIARSNSTASGPSPVTSTPADSYNAPHESPPPQVSTTPTPTAVSACSDSGNFLSLRPRMVNVGADRNQPHADGSRQSPELTVVSAESALAKPKVGSPVNVAEVNVNATDRTSTAVGTSATLPVSEDAQESFKEVSSKVDHMLQNLQRVLHRVYKDGAEDQTNAQQPSRGGDVHSQGQANDTAYSSSFEESGSGGGRNKEEEDIIDVALDSDHIYRDEDGYGVDSEEDEMRLYMRIQHQVSRLGAEIDHFTLPNSSEDGEEAAAVPTPRQGESKGTANALPSSYSAFLPATSQEPRQPAAVVRRARFEIPEAVVQRLCAYRMEHFQYIAYNERLWNTSTTSQFVFAQRLTAALLEECWAEVMAEVDANMSEYVAGLMDHELQ